MSSNKLSPSRAAYFEQLDSDKQDRYDNRIANEILKLMNVKSASIALLRRSSDLDGSSDGSLTPEWVSSTLNSPVVFRAVKNYEIEKKSVFPTPTQLVNKFLHGNKYKKAWNELWLETLDRHGNSSLYCASCFRPTWAKHTMAVHNYDKVLNTPKLPSASLSWLDSNENIVIISTLKSLISALIYTGWTPNITAGT